MAFSAKLLPRKKLRAKAPSAAGTMMADRLQDALRTLKTDYRVVIVMKYFLDLSYEQIGELLNIPVKTVKSRLFMARELLKDILIK